MDFYFATFDQINNPYPIYRKLLLYNGYTINSVPLSSIRFGVSNFWTSATASNQGDYFPTVIRLSGSITSTELGVGTKIAVFFKNLVPFFSATDYETDNTCACGGTIATTCKYFSSNLVANG